MNETETPIQFEQYTHFLSGAIEPTNIEAASRWLMNAKFNSIEKPLTLHINSEGGNLGDAIGLVDLMRGVLSVRTLAYGNLMSAAFIIFAAGEKGYRAVGKNTTIMIHQFNDELGGKYHDMRAYSKECDRYHEKNGTTPFGLLKSISQRCEVKVSAPHRYLDVGRRVGRIWYCRYYLLGAINMLSGGKKFQKPKKTKFHKNREQYENQQLKNQKHHDKSLYRLLKQEKDYVI
jgi:hypothetical protein